MNPNTGKKIVLASLAAAALFAWAFSGAAPRANAMADDAKATYMQKCAVCHGADGSGATAKGKEMKLRDLRSAEVQKQTDAQLSDIIGKGKGKMPGYAASLGKEKIPGMVAYIRSIKAK